jgi:hypothetical protein
MNKQANYFFLSSFFFVVLIIMEFTDIYEPPIWFKVFLIILCVAFLISGFTNRTKDNNKE